jgi:hypothetical protein
MSSSRGWVIALAAAVTLIAGGCGSSSSTSSQASTTQAAQAAPLGARGPTPAEIQARLNLAKCARANGIDLPDPSANGTFGPGNSSIANIVTRYGQTKVNAVEQACRQYLVVAFPNLALTPAQREQRLQALFRFAACMRSNGVPNFPDPGSGKAAINPGDINPNAPAFKSAVTKCESLLPQRPAGGGG